MPTLQDYKKQRGYTNRDIGRLLGCSASTAGMILQGRHIRVYHDTQIDKLATILGITFERCWLAMCESYNQWNNSPGMEHQRADEVRAEVQGEMGFPVETPRSMMIEGSVVIAEDHRIATRLRLRKRD